MSFSPFSPSKNRPASKKKSVPSSCDDVLFGERRKSRKPDPVPEWEPPWVDNGKRKVSSPAKPLLLYCPRTESSSTQFPSRPSSRTLTPNSRKYKTVKFSPTFVDESLFGTRKTKRSNSPPRNEFSPPWVKEEKRVKPVLFDYTSANRVFDSVDKFESSKRTGFNVKKLRSFSASNLGARSQHMPEKPPWR